MTNALYKPVIFQTHTCIDFGAGPLKRFVEPEQFDVLEPTMEVNIVHYKDVEDQRTKLKRYIRVEDEDTCKRYMTGEKRLGLTQSLTHIETISLR